MQKKRYKKKEESTPTADFGLILLRCHQQLIDDIASDDITVHHSQADKGKIILKAGKLN